MVALLNDQIAELTVVVADHFGRHRDAEIYTGQPGFGTVLAARALGDDPNRYTDARAQELRRQQPDHPSLRPAEIELARYARNRRLGDALHQQAFCALSVSPGTRAYYDTLRGRGMSHHAALQQLGNRL